MFCSELVLLQELITNISSCLFIIIIYYYIYTDFVKFSRSFMTRGLGNRSEKTKHGWQVNRGSARRINVSSTANKDCIWIWIDLTNKNQPKLTFVTFLLVCKHTKPWTLTIADWEYVLPGRGWGEVCLYISYIWMCDCNRHGFWAFYSLKMRIYVGFRSENGSGFRVTSQNGSV